ncbi:choline/carnitine O-acyltransferase [Candidatus Mycoplasma pogonae]
MKKIYKNLPNIDNLPNLPWQSDFTVYDRIAEWSRPFFNDEEIEEFLNLAKKFYDSNEKPKIDAIIAKKQTHNSSWLSDWWIKYVYLAGRQAPTPEVNAPFLNIFSNSEKYNALEILAITIHYLAQYYFDFYKKTFLNKTIFKSFNHQVAGLFGAMRLPNHEFDTYFVNDKLAKEIIFMFKNHSFAIEVIKNDQVASIAEIYQTLETITKIKLKQKKYDFNYALSLNDREFETDFLKILLVNKKNQAAFKKVKNAIGVFAYDEDFNQTSKEAIFKNSIANENDLNRWNGKAFQLVIDQNKNMVLLIDHSFVDAVTYGKIFDQINEKFKLNNNFLIKLKVENLEFQQLDFQLTSEQKNVIKNKYSNYIDFVNSVYARAIKLDYLKRSILKKLNVKSIDAFIQLGYQLAYYWTNNQIRNTYIAVDMSKYFMGRTECIRPASLTLLEFIKNFDFYFQNPKTAEIQWNKLQDIHYQRTKLCQAGQGVNRHILGLKLALLENSELDNFKELKKLLASPVIANISGNYISTSTINYEPIKYGYFYPVEADGIGIFYITVDDTYRAMLTAWKNNQVFLDKFIKNLDLAYQSMLKLLKKINALN